MKRVLFIMQSYPSERSANVDCDEKIINELKKNSDIEIYCLTYRYNFQPLSDEYEGFSVFRFEKGLFFDMYSWARHHERSLAGRLLLKIHRLLFITKAIILVPFYPYIEPVGMNQCANAAIKLYEKKHFDLVFADHRGLDTLYAGKRLKDLHPEIKYIAMMWDPIVGKNKSKHVSESFHERRSHKVQDRLISSADMIIMLDSVKDMYAQSAHSYSYYNRIRFCSIPGIIKPEEPTGVVSDDIAEVFCQHKYNIVFTGLITADRNPAQFIDILDSCIFADKINVVFFCSMNNAAIIENVQTQHVSIRIHDYVNKQMLNSVYHMADAFLNLGGNEAKMIPSKLFNYLSYGKPIISTYIVDNDLSAKQLREYPLSCCIDLRTEKEHNVGKLNCFIEEKMSQSLEFDAIQSIYRDSTPSVYAHLIQEQIYEDKI